MSYGQAITLVGNPQKPPIQATPGCAGHGEVGEHEKTHVCVVALHGNTPQSALEAQVTGGPPAWFGPQVVSSKSTQRLMPAGNGTKPAAVTCASVKASKQASTPTSAALVTAAKPFSEQSLS